ncbi:MAG: LamG domain-containing protein [Candidatus Paceibacterota bacterium]
MLKISPKIQTYSLAGLAFTLVALFLIPGSAAAATLSRPPNNLDLVGYWSMDEGRGTQVGDMSGNGNHGSLGGDPQWTSGTRGGAMEFDGDGDYVNVPNFSTGLGSSFTVSAWIYPTANNTASQNVVASEVTSYNNYWFALGNGTSTVRSNKGVFFLFDGANNPGALTDTALTLNQWVHLVGVRSVADDKVYIYRDGVLQGSGTEDITTSVPSYSDFNIGTQLAQPNRFFPGSIDDVRIYSRALTASEISDLYTSGATRISTPVGPASDALVSHWTFDGRYLSGTTIIDRGPNGYNGTRQNNVRPELGKIGQAMRFGGGSGDRINISTSNVIIDESKPLTVAAWTYLEGYNLSSTSQFPAFINLKSSSGSPFSFVFMGTGGSGYRGFFVGNNTYSYRTSGDISSQLLKRWRQAVLTYNGGGFSSIANWKMYLDGVSQSITTGSSWNSGTNINYIGASSHPEDHWNGLLDDIRIYNRVLSVQEIKDLYNATKGSAVNVTPAVTGTSLATGLVGHWTFDGPSVTATTANDVSGNGNHGTIAGNVSPVGGRIGQAFEFDGDGDYVGSIPSLGLEGSVDLTISAWVNPRSVQRQGIFEGSSNGSVSFMLFDSNRMRLAERGVDWVGLSSNTNVPINQWSNIIVVYNSLTNTVQFYLNGDDDGSYVEEVNFANPATQNIGLYRASDSDSYYFDGAIDDVRIYNRALTADEVYRLYTIGR